MIVVLVATVEERHGSHNRVFPQWTAEQYPVVVAETLPMEGISARLAEIRGQLKLLSDYL
jgi:hypothetical protein